VVVAHPLNPNNPATYLNDSQFAACETSGILVWYEPLLNVSAFTYRTADCRGNLTARATYDSLKTPGYGNETALASTPWS
jgi:coproporphyrinogen III oxidase